MRSISLGFLAITLAFTAMAADKKAVYRCQLTCGELKEELTNGTQLELDAGKLTNKDCHGLASLRAHMKPSGASNGALWAQLRVKRERNTARPAGPAVEERNCIEPKTCSASFLNAHLECQMQTVGATPRKHTADEEASLKKVEGSGTATGAKSSVKARKSH